MDRFYNLKAIKPRFPSPFRSTQGEVDGKNPDSDTESLADTSAKTQLPTINVVLFGETGVGKSSVINLIAQDQVAEVSSNVDGCTMQSTRYIIPFDGLNFAIFDTIGLEEPQYGVNGYLKAIEKAYELIMKLSAAGGIHLLLFCMRGGRITATTQSNYRLFCECLCSTKVPIALVFTGLEREEEMENWWTRNKNHIEHYGIKSDGHACITAVRDDTPGEDLKFTESQKKIRELLKDCALKNDAFVLEAHSWFARLGRGMLSFIAKRKSPKKRDVLTVLTKRCKLDSDTAKRIAEMIEKGDPEAMDPRDGAPANPTSGAGQGENGGEENSILPQQEFSDPPNENEGLSKPAAPGHSPDPRRHNNAEVRSLELKEEKEAERRRLKNAGAVENDTSLVQKPSDTSNNANKPATEHSPHLKQHSGSSLGPKENEADRGRLRGVGTLQNDVPLVQEPHSASNESKDANKHMMDSLRPEQHGNAEAGPHSLGLEENRDEAYRNKAMKAEAVGKGVPSLPELGDTSNKSEDANEPTTEHPPYLKQHRVAQARPLEPKKENEIDNARVRAVYGYSNQPQEGNVQPDPGSRNNDLGRKKTNSTPFPALTRSADQQRGLNMTSQWSAVSSYGRS